MRLRLPHKNADLVLINLVALAAVLFSGLGLSQPLLRSLYALPMALFIPGYSLAAAFFVGGVVNSIQRVSFILGFSLTSTTLSGLLLNWTPWGLQPFSWAIWLGVLTAGASLVAFYRRRTNPLQPTTMAVLDDLREDYHLSLRQIILIGLGIGLIGMAILVSSLGANQPRTSFTQLWLLPADKTAIVHSVELGIHSEETTTLRYRLQLKAQDVVLKEWPLIELKPGQDWKATVAIDRPNLNFEAVDAVLYRLDQPANVYRLVTLWRDQPTATVR